MPMGVPKPLVKVSLINELLSQRFTFIAIIFINYIAKFNAQLQHFIWLRLAVGVNPGGLGITLPNSPKNTTFMYLCD